MHSHHPPDKTPHKALREGFEHVNYPRKLNDAMSDASQHSGGERNHRTVFQKLPDRLFGHFASPYSTIRHSS